MERWKKFCERKVDYNRLLLLLLIFSWVKQWFRGFEYPRKRDFVSTHGKSRGLLCPSTKDVRICDTRFVSPYRMFQPFRIYRVFHENRTFMEIHIQGHANALFHLNIMAHVVVKWFRLHTKVLIYTKADGWYFWAFFPAGIRPSCHWVISDICERDSKRFCLFLHLL